MARRQAIESAIARIDQLAAERPLSEEILRPIRSNHTDRLKHIKHRSDRDDSHRRHVELRDEIELLLLEAERQKINELFRSGKLKDEARRRIERELNVREAHLTNQRAEE
jgi:CPA1 family monovalent cation:H+ antiporter